MSSTIAMYTALSGLNANSRSLDVTGNNIANVNSIAFKTSRMQFATNVSSTFREGTAPGASTGGSNPGVIGLGVQVSGTQRDFRPGTLSPTGDPRDLAIEGNGFFIVRRGDKISYTRAGSFRPDSNNQLTTVTGERLQGYAVDSNFAVRTGELTNLSIPVGSLTLAQQTQRTQFAGNLNAGGTAATQGSLITLDALTLIGGGVVNSGGTLLTQIDDAANPGAARFAAGQSIRIANADKGAKRLPDAVLQVTGATTVDDLMTFIAQATGIQGTGGGNPDGRTPGVTLDTATGVISIVGNTGSLNDLDIRDADFAILDASGTNVGEPFGVTKVATADGEAARTSFIVYDSLGTPISVDLSFVLESKGAAGTRWRFFADSADDSDLAIGAGTGLVTFDPEGQYITTTNNTATINRDGTGAETPMAFSLDFISGGDRLTSLTDTSSAVAATYQDGSPIGTLVSYAVGQDGIITGAFSNGLTRTVGQIALANFTNPEGLNDIGSSLYQVGANSGTPIVTTPTLLGTGRVIGGTLELSNVDLSQEFINMLQASTGYSAASRVISTTDQLMQQLLVLGR